MNIVFIYPYEQGNTLQTSEFNRVKEPSIIFNFAIAQLSAVLKQNNHITSLVPLTSEQQKTPVGDLKIEAADVIAFSFSESELAWCTRLSNDLKKAYPDKVQIGGGIGAILNHDFVLNNTSMDFVCVGEGEYAFPEVLRRFEDNEDTRGIMNLHCKINNEIFLSEIGEIVKDLDTLPPYDYELFDDFPLKHLQSNLPRLYYLVGRNCQFNCTFCANHRKKKAMGISKMSDYLRRFSPERVIQDIQGLQIRYPQAKVVHFNDEIIHSDLVWFEEFALLYKERINLPWRSYASLAILREKTVVLMQLSNCYRVNVGIESGSERIRKDIYNRPRISNADIIRKIGMLKAAGIGVHASNLFGAPTETIDDMFDTLLLNAEAGVDIPVSGVVVPYRNTRLYEISKELGKLDKTKYNNEGVSILTEPGVTKVQVQFLREYTVEIVKILQYARTLSEESKEKIVSFVYWLIKNREVDFDLLIHLNSVFFREHSLDLVYERMEGKFGRKKS